ncbi:MAG: tRNA 4-thiouridine(8) synthase ThiI [SAR324 cluster bacterium]|nr:tRNA 4-thiouridine(8) synthase ThiI [SAR324 cluster bacterium]
MNTIIVRYGEIGLKGKNRQLFEKRLVDNIRIHLKPYGQNKVRKCWGRLEIETNYDLDVIKNVLRTIPGIANFSPAAHADLRLESMEDAAKKVIEQELEQYSALPITFRVTAKRANKQFPIFSTEIEAQLGEALLSTFPQLKVRLLHPMLEVGVEVREKDCIVYTEKIPGMGGLPVHSRERVVSLISGGIDSPVASWMMMKRGCLVIYLYFHSFPFVGEQTKEKVFDLIKILRIYQPYSRLYIAPFAEIQKAIKAQTPEKFRTILYRRFMNQIANRIVKKERAQAIVTGDSLAQVASQTLNNLISITENAAYPVLRPLIGMDKQEITALSKSIGTYTTSIQDFPDCCTVFQPSKPATKSFLPEVQKVENSIESLEQLVDQAVEGCEIYNYACHDNQAIVEQ